MPILQVPFQNLWERTQACAISSDRETWCEQSFGKNKVVPIHNLTSSNIYSLVSSSVPARSGTRTHNPWSVPSHSPQGYIEGGRPAGHTDHSMLG